MSSNLFPVSYHKTILLILITIMGLFILYMLREFFSAILGAILIYTLFTPLYNWFYKKKKLGKVLSAILVMLISMLIIVLPFIGASVMMAGRIAELGQDPNLINNLVQKVNEFMGKYSHDPAFLQHRLAGIQQGLIVFLSKFINGFLSTILTILIMYFILYFILTDSATFENALSKVLPLKQEGRHRLGMELRNITYSNIIGQGIIALAQGTCIVAGFLVVGIPDALFWGLISAFLSFIPMIGVPSMFIGSALYCFLTHNVSGGIIILVWGVVVIVAVENFLRLYLARRIANVHPLITVIGVLVGIPTFGIVGIVFGPLLLSYFILLVSIYQNDGSPEEAKESVVKKPAPHRKHLE